MQEEKEAAELYIWLIVGEFTPTFYTNFISFQVIILLLREQP